MLGELRTTMGESSAAARTRQTLRFRVRPSLCIVKKERILPEFIREGRLMAGQPYSVPSMIGDNLTLTE